MRTYASGRAQSCNPRKRMTPTSHPHRRHAHGRSVLSPFVWVLIVRVLHMNITASFTNGLFNTKITQSYCITFSLEILFILTALDRRIARAGVVADTLAMPLVIRKRGRRAAPTFDAPLHVCIQSYRKVQRRIRQHTHTHTRFRKNLGKKCLTDHNRTRRQNLQLRYL